MPKYKLCQEKVNKDSSETNWITASLLKTSKYHLIVLYQGVFFFADVVIERDSSRKGNYYWTESNWWTSCRTSFLQKTCCYMCVSLKVWCTVVQSMLLPLSTEQLLLMSDSSETWRIIHSPQPLPVSMMSSDPIYLIKTLPNTNRAWITMMYYVLWWAYFSIFYLCYCYCSYLKHPPFVRIYLGSDVSYFV